MERQEAAELSQRLQSDVRIIEQTSLRQVRDLAEKERAIGVLQNKVGNTPVHWEQSTGRHTPKTAASLAGRDFILCCMHLSALFWTGP